MSFLKEGYEVVRNVLSDDLLHHLKIQTLLKRDLDFFKKNTNYKYAFNDNQCHECYSGYSALHFESLAISLNEKMNEITGKKLYPTYSYFRIYYKGVILEPHTDRESCEYSTTICIDSTDIWDFYIEDRSKKEIVLKLNPGDMCVYSGCELKHWRKPYEGECQIQCFLHYVDSEGPHKHFKYDRRRMMGMDGTIYRELKYS